MFTIGTTYTLDGTKVTVIAAGTTYRQGTPTPVVFVSPVGGPITRLVGNQTYRLS